ncbi:MAG: hypothetical protein PHF86_10550 [Candidatus Nanoarchaeia archaeon]|nr:hypothetical protein [Candidatus Nanoarchaeia archaeon]
MVIRKKDLEVLKSVKMHIDIISTLTRELRKNNNYSESVDILLRRAAIIESLIEDPSIKKFLKIIDRIV